MNIFTKINLFLFLVVMGFQSFAYSQSLQRIEHLRGTKQINGIKVTVSGKGQVDSLHYCGEDGGPFYLGYNYAKPHCGDGTYTINFSEPVSELVINLSALSHSNSYDEEARFYVNGVRVQIKTPGTKNGCGEGLCIITSEGNILPCRDCSGSGMNGIKISGPITTFTIECKIVNGEPMGFVAGIWMNAKPAVVENTLVNYSYKFEESAAGAAKLLVLEGNFENAELSIKDKNGMKYPLFYRSVETNKIVLDLGDLRRGEFILEIKNGAQIENQKILIL
jgi:hypothetical protein